jgi:hypothetical protein
MPPLPLHACVSPAAGTFTANLKRSVIAHPPSKSQQIAVLLPKIEAAMAQGSSRAHITAALLGVGIDVTQDYLSTVMARLRRRRKDAVLPQPSSNDGAKARVDAAPASLAPAWVASVPTLVFPPNAKPTSTGTASKYGAHDPRLLDEVMRSTPDMKALAKLAPKPTPQGTP